MTEPIPPTDPDRWRAGVEATRQRRDAKREARRALDAARPYGLAARQRSKLRFVTRRAGTGGAEGHRHEQEEVVAVEAVTEATHRYAVDDVVVGDFDDAVNYATVLSLLDRATSIGEVDLDGAGPLYRVNVGNVFSGMYKCVVAESRITGYLDSHDPDPAAREARNRTMPKVCSCGNARVPEVGGVCDDCDTEYQRGFAMDHVRKGFADDNDLAWLGMTREQADQVAHEQYVSALADRGVDVLREALALAEKRDAAAQQPRSEYAPDANVTVPEAGAR